MVPIIPKLDYHQWLKYIHLSFGKSIHLEEFNMLVFIVKIVYWSKKKLPRDLCSPGSRQLLQMQPFSQIFQILDPLDFILPGIVWFPEICHSSAINFDFLKTVEFVYFQSLTFSLPMILFYHYRKFIEDWVGALVLYAAIVSEVKWSNFTTT